MLYEWFSITRTIGLIAYTFALLACLYGWMSARKQRAPGLVYASLTGMQLALLLDKAFDWRWKLHEYWMRAAMKEDVYSGRRPVQLLGLTALLIAMGFGCLWILRTSRGRPGLGLALTGTLLSIGLWCSEAVSYHNLDRVLLFKVGGAMLVSFLWAGLALVTAIGVLQDTRRYSDT